jgi:hypothetical protein
MRVQNAVALCGSKGKTQYFSRWRGIVNAGPAAPPTSHRPLLTAHFPPHFPPPTPHRPLPTAPSYGGFVQHRCWTSRPILAISFVVSP